MKRSALLAGILAALSLVPLRAADPATPAPPQSSAEKSDKPMHPGMKGRSHEGPGGWGAHRGMDRGPRGFRDKGGSGGACEKGACPMAADMLQLSEEQKKKVKEAMKAAKPRIAAIRAEEEAKIAAVMAEAVRPLLDEKQQAVFDDLQKLRQDRASLKAASAAAKKTE
jgi:hypothetical protein